MHSIRFLPNDIELKVSPGTLISDAAIMAGIEDLHMPCGGKGTCGKCLVEIVTGHTDQFSSSHVNQALAGKNFVVSCQTKINEDLVVRVSKAREASMKVVGDSHFLISEEYLPDKNNLTPLYRIEYISVPAATIDEHYSDWQRLIRELTKDIGMVPVRTDLRVLRSLAEALRVHEGKVTVVVQEEDLGLRITDVIAGYVDVKVCGIAVDIGTTTVAVDLVNLIDGKLLSAKTSYNAQIRRGSDVISRIDYAKNPKRLLEMKNLVLETINELVEQVCDDSNVSRDNVKAAFVAGNTTMIHLLLGLEPRHIREAPYVPTVNVVPSLTAGDIGIAINPVAVVECAPGVGSYVGGDITSGLICTDLPVKNDEVYLFLDIGTNGEIVLGNADWMVTCACSAGPAFEGSGIRCGMRAAGGAIEYLEISDDAKNVTYDVIGGGKSVGVCGSGLICLLGELFVKGIVDQMGHFNMELGSERLIEVDNTKGFVIEWGNNTSDGNNLIITELDIENLMRTKAAIYAACSLIMANVGLDWDSISRVFIAGGFGRYVQIEDAVLIGLLPDLPYEKFSYIGNSSLTGAYIALLARERRLDLLEIANKMTYIDLSSDPKYMDSYLGAMFLPHTDINNFPNVTKKIEERKQKQLIVK